MKQKNALAMFTIAIIASIGIGIAGVHSAVEPADDGYGGWKLMESTNMHINADHMQSMHQSMHNADEIEDMGRHMGEGMEMADNCPMMGNKE